MLETRLRCGGKTPKRKLMYFDYVQSDPSFGEENKRRFGCSRDKRPDCAQVVIALVMTPKGLPLTYEVLPGNTADETTLGGFLDRIEGQHGKARRAWAI